MHGHGKVLNLISDQGNVNENHNIQLQRGQTGDFFISLFISLTLLNIQTCNMWSSTCWKCQLRLSDADFLVNHFVFTEKLQGWYPLKLWFFSLKKKKTVWLQHVSCYMIEKLLWPHNTKSRQRCETIRTHMQSKCMSKLVELHWQTVTLQDDVHDTQLRDSQLYPGYTYKNIHSSVVDNIIPNWKHPKSHHWQKE